MTTTGDDVPVVTPQASVASMSAPAVPVVPFTDCPVFRNPHCKPKDVSFGTTTTDARAVVALASTNTAATAADDNLCATRDIVVFSCAWGFEIFERPATAAGPDRAGRSTTTPPRRTFLTPDADVINVPVTCGSTG